MTQHRSLNRASHHLVDLDARYRERLRRGHAHAPVESVPADGTLLDVVPLPDTGKVLMIVAHVVPASAAPPEAPADAEPVRLPVLPHATADAPAADDVPAAGDTLTASAGPASAPAGPAGDASPPLSVIGPESAPAGPAGPERPAAGPGGEDSAPAESVPAESVPAESVPAESVPAESVPADPAPRDDAPREALCIDRSSRRVWVEGREIGLTYQEFELLAHFTTHPWQVFSRTELMRALWPAVDATTRTVDVHVHRLRRKLGSAGSQLATVRRVGYTYRPRAAHRSEPAPARG
jgi:hypothetical protein